MINEICNLHRQLDFDHNITLKMGRYDYETIINKVDILKKVNSHTLKVISPTGQVLIINLEFVMTAFTTKKMEW